jgi:hypothetical protein
MFTVNSILSQINPIHILTSCFLKINFDTMLLPTALSPLSDFPHSGFPKKTLYEFLRSSHLFQLNLIIFIIKFMRKI